MAKKQSKVDKIKSKNDFDIDLEAEYDNFDVDSIFDDKPQDGGRVTRLNKIVMPLTPRHR